MSIGALGQISQEDLTRRIVEELEAIIVTDAEGRYRYVNTRWSSITGYSPEEVRGKYVHDMVRSTCVDDVLKNRKYVSGNAVLINVKTKQEIPVYCAYTPLFHGDILEGCLVYMIQKSEQEPLAIPSNVIRLIEELNSHLQLVQGIGQEPDYLDKIVGNSPQIAKMKDQIVKAARSASTVLIEGETGSGKELVAHAIHVLSPRRDGRLIKVNCAAIPAELLESEFFGYVEGSFTGARKGGAAGKFEMSNGGSLFLDEIGQMPFPLQPKLLRALQEREIERIGSSKSIPIDTRIIAATNESLVQLVDEGKFRSDLYYRLNVIKITIPPLRQRREDIPLLLNSLLKQLNYQLHLQIPGIERETVAHLMEYDWPGNVRELQNVLERAMNLAWCETLEWKHFSDYFSHLQPLETKPLFTKGPSTPALRHSVDCAERGILADALRHCGGNKAKTAKMLGISRTILYKKLHRYDLL